MKKATVKCKVGISRDGDTEARGKLTPGLGGQAACSAFMA